MSRLTREPAEPIRDAVRTQRIGDAHVLVQRIPLARVFLGMRGMHGALHIFPRKDRSEGPQGIGRREDTDDEIVFDHHRGAEPVSFHLVSDFGERILG